MRKENYVCYRRKNNVCYTVYDIYVFGIAKRRIRIVMNNQLLVKNIRFLCKTNGLKVGDLEKQVGVHVGYFARLYNDITNISATNLYKVSKIFDISMNDLIERNLYKEQRIKKLKKELEELENE